MASEPYWAAALAVDEDQRVVGGEVAQVRGPDDGRGVADELDADVEGRDDGPQLVREGRLSLGREVLAANDVDGHRRLDHRPGLGARADDHDQLLDADAHLDVEDGGSAGAHLDDLRGRFEAGQRERHLVGPRTSSPLNEYWPVPSVKVTSPPPAASRASTVTLGRTRPVESVTVPLMEADRARCGFTVGVQELGLRHVVYADEWNCSRGGGQNRTCGRRTGRSGSVPERPR